MVLWDVNVVSTPLVCIGNCDEEYSVEGVAVKMLVMTVGVHSE